MKPVYQLVSLGISLQELEAFYSLDDLNGVMKAFSENRQRQ